MKFEEYLQDIKEKVMQEPFTYDKVDQAFFAGTKFDEHQKKAVLCNNRIMQVVAGAGAGKTGVLTKRIEHLIKNKGVKENEILAVTFSRKAAEEMEERSKHRSVNISTFHSFCMKNLGKFIGNYMEVLNDERILKLLEECLDYFDENQLLKLKNYLIEYVYDKVNKVREKPYWFDKSKKCYLTGNGLWVESKSERDIANFLFEHGISFKYKNQKKLGDITIKPDFYLPEHDLCIEHWENVDKENLRYKNDKKTLYSQFLEIKLLEIEEREMVDIYQVYNKILKTLNKHSKNKIKIKKQRDVLLNLPAYRKALNRFISTVMDIISRINANMISEEELEKKVSAAELLQTKEFYAILIPLHSQYKKLKKERSWIDFNDMLLKFLEKANDPKYKHLLPQPSHVLVDEFQDCSKLQIKIIESIMSNNTNLFCVGDDWQSIYGWRGTDLEYFVNFGDYFKKSKRLLLPYNYRSCQEIVNLSNSFIKKVGKSIDKTIISNAKIKGKVELIQIMSTEDSIFKIKNKLIKLHKNGQKPISSKEVLILGRTNNAIKYCKEKLDNKKLIEDKCFSTIHKAKGLEAENVFVVGLDDGPEGFPNIWEDPEIYRIISNFDINEKYHEERRVFYVAMTRAMRNLFLVANKDMPSKFVKELDFGTKFSYKGVS